MRQVYRPRALLMLLSAKDDNLLLLIGGLLYTVIKNESLLLKETKDQPEPNGPKE